MLEITFRNLEKITKSVFKKKGKLLTEIESSRNKDIREIAIDLAYNILKNLGYDFKFHSTPIYQLANILNIEEKIEKNILREAELYKTRKGWAVIHREGTREERRRFSLCHEIAHIILSSVNEQLSHLDNEKIEKFCDMIAAELLVPSYLFEVYTLNEVQTAVSCFLSAGVEKDDNEIKATNGPRLNFSIFEAMRNHLRVSRLVLAQQLHWTKFLNNCESGIILSWESVNRYTGRTPALRVTYTALPTWGYLPINRRIKNIGLFSALVAFDSLDHFESIKWKEAIKVKEKKENKWPQKEIESCGEHTLISFNHEKYMVTTLNWPKPKE
jgi:hypothetical protein